MSQSIKAGFFAVAIGFAILVSDPINAQLKTTHIEEQTQFCEDSLPSAPAPQVVIAAVMNSKEGRQAEADSLANRSKLNPTDLLTSTAVQLSTGRSKYFLVTGKGDLSGADNTWFWIVRDYRGTAISISWFGANCVRMKQAKTLGLRDIVTEWSSASYTQTQLYKFNGRSYRLVRTYSRRHY